MEIDAVKFNDGGGEALGPKFYERERALLVLDRNFLDRALVGRVAGIAVL